MPANPQVRIIAVSVLVNTIGTGMFMTAGTLYFVRVLHLGIDQVAIGLTIGGVAGLLLVLPIGRIVDRVGAREVYITLLLIQALTRFAFGAHLSFAFFVAVTAISTAAAVGSTGTVGALIAKIGKPGERLPIRAYLRSVTNIGVTFGAIIGGGVVQLDSMPAYVAGMLGNGLAFAIAALALFAIPSTAQRKSPSDETVHNRPIHPRRNVLTDRPYMSIVLTNALLTLHYDVMTFALPLWIVQNTAAPRWTVSLVVVCNTAVVVLFQVRMARSSTTIGGAAAAVRRAGLFFLIAWSVIGLAQIGQPVMATILLCAGVLVHTVGELWQANGSFTLSYDLAPDDAHGQYQASFVLGRGAARMIAPMLLTGLCLTAGTIGWFALGMIVMLTGILVPPLARRAEIQYADGQRGARSTSLHR